MSLWENGLGSKALVLLMKSFEKAVETGDTAAVIQFSSVTADQLAHGPREAILDYLVLRQGAAAKVLKGALSEKDIELADPTALGLLLYRAGKMGIDDAAKKMLKQYE